MKKDIREFRFVSKDKILVWRIGKNSSTSYITEHGILGSKMQINSDTPGSKGVEGTKSFVSAEANLNFHLEREIRKKTEHGYIEYVNGEPIAEQITEMSFDKLLPKNFCSYKPQTDIKPKDLEKIHKAGRTRYSRKYDGFCCLAAHHPWGWEIYSRRMDLITGHFPKQVQELDRLTHLQSGTLLVGEMLCLKGDNLDDFKATSRVCRSKEKESLELRESGEVPEPVFVIFDALFHNNEDLQDKTYDERSSLWKSMTAVKNRTTELVVSVDYFDVAPDTWEAYAKARGWEGFVVTDGKAKPGDKFYNFSGKPKRPLGSHKLKPCYDADVVVYAGLRGTGKRLDCAGSVFVKQLHPDTGEWFDCGKVGSGFTDQSVVEVTQRLKDAGLPIIEGMKEAKNLNFKELTGFTIEIEYSERQPGTNKFRYPVFQRFRDDKAPEECEAQRLAPEDEE